ncbi:low affinity immunoglobulin epsilon Fc receptor isoform X2 [Rhinolophus sinicus]|uniref:low affinity immunoglobulin epsilon Fc receptor isoform X2 n=1 Tax=Rhinolophus sinicus TaxID=89399 RepID=UPI000942E270|nr:PREDICTED: low affinity immunoglobulin epsilon Fc receptor isoform X2 [Rhinolophus sinicus]
MEENSYSEVLKFHRRHGQCCRRGTQIALLGLVFTALWAGLLTLLLLWHWDTERNLKQLKETAAWNISQVSKDFERHTGDQMAQKSQAAQMMQNMEKIRAEQKRMKTQESELSQNLDGLLEDLSNLKSQGLNERHTALNSLERLQEEVAKLWIELRVSNARTPRVTPGETLPPTLPIVPMVPATAPTPAPTIVPTTAPTMVHTTAPTPAPATAPTMVPTTAPTLDPATAPTMVPTTAPTPAPATAPTMVPTTTPTTAAPLSLSSTPGSMCNTCPEEWVNFQRKCYYFGEGAKKWIQARLACSKLQGRLVSIHSQEEQDFLAKYINRRGSWIGLRDLNIEGEFVWMDQNPLDYSNWRPGEPSNGGDTGLGEDCVMMLGSGQWNDAFCSNPLDGWVCDRLATC